MRRVQIRALLQNYKEIPTVPSVVETVTALTADVNCSLAALEAAIKIDQSCVARLLQVANSAFYGSGVNRTVTSVRRAILMFGFNAVQNITLSLTAFDCFRTQNAAEIATVHAIRLHSVAVANLAQRIAQTSPCDLDPELAYCAGLLHDLGRVVLLHLFPQEYHQLLTQSGLDLETDMSKVEFDTFCGDACGGRTMARGTLAFSPAHFASHCHASLHPSHQPPGRDGDAREHPGQHVWRWAGGRSTVFECR
jgi:HD-like signal output (HDOD) protein